MIDPKSVAFDIDGVLADTMGLFIDIARREFQISGLQYADITSYSLEDCLDIDRQTINAILAKVLTGPYDGRLEPMHGAPAVLTRLAGRVRPLLFVTARNVSEPIQEWIRGLLPIPAAGVEVIATGDFDGKKDVLLDRNISFFIEDRLESCYDLKAAGIEPVLFRQPWNRQRHPFAEIGSWKEIETLIDWTAPPIMK